MYYRILKADQRAFERLVLSENMVSVSGGMLLRCSLIQSKCPLIHLPNSFNVPILMVGPRLPSL